MNAVAQPATGAPRVSVVMTSFQDPWLRLQRAIDSILQQSFRDLELIVAFEPADQNAAQALEHYNDPRLVVLKNPQRKGMAGSFNHCLDHARGRYIARMDSDDAARPERIEKELAFLARRPDVDIVGGGTVIIDESGRPIAERIFPAEHDDIIRHFALLTPICHPSVMWDTDKVGHIRYDPRFSVEDVELWMRLLSQGRRFANISEYLIEYKQTNEWRRPMRNWRGNARVRLAYWRLALRHPSLLFGMLLFCGLALMPKFVVDAVTRRSRFSDTIRAIRKLDAA